MAEDVNAVMASEESEKMTLEFPPRIAKLPRWLTNGRLYPVPYFVAWMKDGERCLAGEGEPDFRVADALAWTKCVRHSLCWVCGEKLGVYKAFSVGPMCTVNRVSSEPPSHLECAMFSAQTCPFLTHPRRRRNAKDLPPEHGNPGGEMIERNPGVTCIWVTRSFKIFNDGKGNPLIEIGDPDSVSWFAEGRKATRAEIMASIDSGYPILMGMAQYDGARAIAALEQARDAAMALVPA
jgi:hypothetical protein